MKILNSDFPFLNNLWYTETPTEWKDQSKIQLFALLNRKTKKVYHIQYTFSFEAKSLKISMLRKFRKTIHEDFP